MIDHASLPRNNLADVLAQENDALKRAGFRRRGGAAFPRRKRRWRSCEQKAPPGSTARTGWRSG